MFYVERIDVLPDKKSWKMMANILDIEFIINFLKNKLYFLCKNTNELVSNMIIYLL